VPWALQARPLAWVVPMQWLLALTVEMTVELRLPNVQCGDLFP
jgi:hypothetical protein